MKKGFKSLITIATMCCCLLVGGITAHAQTVNEADSNDTMETAQLIQANRETAAQAVSGSRPNQYVINGYTSLTDEDWYKVYLTADTQYVTCNDNAFKFEVYSPDGSLITSETYVKESFGVTAYPFDAATAGYYYVKVTGITTSSKSYILLVGGPTYTVSSCEVELDTVTMADGENEQVSFNLGNENRLPDNAIVYSVSMNGVKTTSVRRIAVTNNRNSTVNLTRYSWNKYGLVSMNMGLKSEWGIEFGYNKNTTFTPSIEFSYVYPVISEHVEDNIVIIQ